ncbi:hypothetical protein HK097_002862 [Rhizophlyctis rosea]|uniref:Uncharacterized protein n=1 Tax=Rhizophlyctis rosea TaxID=64517 RepID=A0AAD5S4W2_9FUNG|nr:hypothetical protein HK097_002862 [Rhizophlyctis rosea]
METKSAPKPPFISDRGFLHRPASRIRLVETIKPTLGDAQQNASTAPPKPSCVPEFPRSRPTASKKDDPTKKVVRRVSKSGNGQSTKQSTRPPIPLPKGPMKMEAPKPRQSVMPPQQASRGHVDMVIDLPVSDTPMIIKNKEMRNGKGRRRSSLGLRGKRVSMSNNGLCQPPHMTIDPADFYRHIDAEQSEPVRMRQLLLWCSQRIMEENRPAEGEADNETLKAFRKVQEEVIVGLISKQINTSWYHRPNIPLSKPNDEPQRLPHPQNEENAKKVAELEVALERLKQESNQWTTLLKTHQTAHAKAVDDLDSLRSHGAIDFDAEPAETVDKLEEKEQAILKEYCDPMVLQEVDVWTGEMVDALRIEIDHTEHVLRGAAASERKTQRFCDDLFGRMLKAYDEKERKEKVADPMDILRLLSTAPPTSAR